VLCCSALSQAWWLWKPRTTRRPRYVWKSRFILIWHRREQRKILCLERDLNSDLRITRWNTKTCTTSYLYHGLVARQNTVTRRSCNNICFDRGLFKGDKTSICRQKRNWSLLFYSSRVPPTNPPPQPRAKTTPGRNTFTYVLYNTNNSEEHLSFRYHHVMFVYTVKW
jgi:hypothetical protein